MIISYFLFFFAGAFPTEYKLKIPPDGDIITLTEA